MPEISFESMQPKHLPQVLKIENRSFPTPWSKNAFLGELRHNRFAHYYVCWMDSKLIAYAGVWIILDEAHITNIAVDPPFRGQQLGRRLLLFLMHQALALGADRITLEVRPSNVAARKLYTALGFVEAGLRKGYYTDNNEDAIIMWKNLMPDDGDEVEDEKPIDTRGGNQL